MIERIHKSIVRFAVGLLGVLADFRRDCAYTFRQFRRSPVLAATVILTLALGIGTTTAVYSIIDAAFFRPLPFPDAKHLVVPWPIVVPIDSPTPLPKIHLDINDLDALRDVFPLASAYATGELNLGSGSQPLRVEATFVTTGFFDTLQSKAMLGRTFTREETSSGGPSAVVLSNGLWRSQFGGDPSVIGRNIILDGRSYAVVGVMPAAFRFPAEAQVWLPLPVPAPLAIMPAFRNNLPAAAIARIAAGVPLQTARERLQNLAVQRVPPTGAGNLPIRRHIESVIPLQRSLVGDRSKALAVLMASAMLLLLVACSNAATLLLSHALTRSPEFALESALGATRGRIIRRLLTENLILACAGAVFGVAIASSTVSTLSALLPASLSGIAPAGVDARVLMVALGSALATALLVGIWPALLASRSGCGELLKSSNDHGFTRPRRVSRCFVVIQVAVAFVLVTGCALMLISLRSLLGTELGMRTDGVVTARLNLPTSKYGRAARINFVRSIVSNLAAAPSVSAAAAINSLPFAHDSRVMAPVDAEDAAAPASDRIFSRILDVSPGYFRALGIAFLRGRDVAWSDTARQVVVINRALAEHLWPGRDALGKRLRFLGSVRTVIGIVDDARISNLATPLEPQVYQPVSESPDHHLSLVVDSKQGDGRELIPLIRRAVHDLDPTLPIYAARPLASLVTASVATRRFNTLLSCAFGALALLLAAIGIYGSLAYSVAQRTREIGVRMALGAEQNQVMALVVLDSLRLVAAGIVLGVAAAFAMTRYLEGMLYGITPHDPVTFAAVALLFLITALVGSAVPARTAAKLDPLRITRHE